MRKNSIADAIFDFIFKNNVDGDTGKQQVLWDICSRDITVCPVKNLPRKRLAHKTYNCKKAANAGNVIEEFNTALLIRLQ